jgi:hypothetical protein
MAAISTERRRSACARKAVYTRLHTCTSTECFEGPTSCRSFEGIESYIKVGV